ncbi:ABI3 protein, partial [Sylvietta virens]|nr:ABI3 protein [Sylvietta virens]
ELEQLRLSRVPEGRRLLRDQHGNLLRVAEYCQGNYLQAGDKRKALQETMALSAQSLASVASQVGSVAGALLRLPPLQAAQLRRLEGDVASPPQRVAPPKEKVSRREIGALSVPPRLPGCPEVAAPPEPPPPEPYYRNPLDFSALDAPPHGVKDTSTQLSRTGTLARRGTKPCSAQAGAALGRSGRVPEPVRPPTVPPGKLPAAPGSSEPAPRGSQTPWEKGQGIPNPLGKGTGDPKPPGERYRGSQTPGERDRNPKPPGERDRGSQTPGSPGPAPAQPPSGAAVAPVPSAGAGPSPAAGWARSMSPVAAPAVVALYPYARQKDNELSLEPGALLFVTRRYSDGWCEGVLGHRSGFFPGNYVEPL